MNFLYSNSDKMGEGDPELGKKLLGVFLKTLLDSDVPVDFIGCVNSGINLTTEGSDVIDILRKFEQKGARIASCGTCLDHYHKRDKLLVGELGSMKMTVEVIAKADKIICPN